MPRALLGEDGLWADIDAVLRAVDVAAHTPLTLIGLMRYTARFRHALSAWSGLVRACADRPDVLPSMRGLTP